MNIVLKMSRECTDVAAECDLVIQFISTFFRDLVIRICFNIFKDCFERRDFLNRPTQLSNWWWFFSFFLRFSAFFLRFFCVFLRFSATKRWYSTEDDDFMLQNPLAACITNDRFCIETDETCIWKWRIWGDQAASPLPECLSGAF